MPASPRARLLSILTAVAVLLAAVIAALGGGGGDGVLVPSVTVPSQHGPAVVVPLKDLSNVQDSEAGHHDANLRDESALTPKDKRANAEKASPLTPRVSGPPPLASPQQAGCLTRQIPHNFSNRNGTRPLLIVLHYTVSHNVVGWGDVNSIFAFFSQSSTQASSNYVNDNEGHCIYMVPETQKAWAQAGFNSYTACSFEVVNTGSEPTYVGPFGGPGERQLAREVHDCAQRWHIPIRQGKTSGCQVVRSGIVDHHSLGSCGGGHFDIGHYSVPRIIQAASKSGVAPVTLATGKAQALCNLMVRYRIRRLARLPLVPHEESNYLKRTTRLRAGGWACYRHGTSPVGKLKRRHA
jgi:hypothetical protein